MVDSGTIHLPALSDHDAVYCTLMARGYKNNPIFKTYRDFSNFDMLVFLDHLRSIPWRNVYDLNQIDLKVNFFNYNVNALLDLHAPFKTSRITKKCAPWLSADLKYLLQQRERAYSAYKRAKNKDDYTIYQQLRNRATASVRCCKQQYFQNSLQSRDQGRIWRDLRLLNVQSKKNINPLPDHLSDVRLLSHHFQSVSPQLNAAAINDTLALYRGNHRNFDNRLHLQTVSDNVVLRVLRYEGHFGGEGRH